MNLTKGTKIAIGFGIILFAVYMLYMALPFLIAMASNILYLSGVLIFVIVGIYAFIHLGKWMSKSSTASDCTSAILRE